MREGRVLSGIRPSYLSDKAVIINIKNNRIMSMFCAGHDSKSRLFQSYENFDSLTNEELQYALRIVHRELEKKLEMSLADDEFIQLFSSIKKERFLHPAGPWSGVTMRNVYNEPFIRLAYFSNDEKRIAEIKAKRGWYIAREADICHKFFREPFTTYKQIEQSKQQPTQEEIMAYKEELKREFLKLPGTNQLSQEELAKQMKEYLPQTDSEIASAIMQQIKPEYLVYILTI